MVRSPEQTKGRKPRKARTAAQKELDKDKRIRTKFGITLADRDARIREQESRCKICGGPLDAYGPPNIDHFHFYVQAAQDTVFGDWTAQAFNERREVQQQATAATKHQAIAIVRALMMPWSIRGILCFKCNKGLGYIERFFDAARHPENLTPVMEYLQERLDSLSDSAVL